MLIRVEGTGRELIALALGGRATDEARALAWLAAFDVRAWRDLDVELRASWREFHGRPVLPRLEREDGTLLPLLAASHPDGYLRQAAVFRLAATDDPVVLAALALRTGDWCRRSATRLGRRSRRA